MTSHMPLNIVRIRLRFLYQQTQLYFRLYLYGCLFFTGMEEFMVEPTSRPPPPLPPPRFSRSVVWHNLYDFQRWKYNIFVYFILLLRPTSAKLLQRTKKFSVYSIYLFFSMGNWGETFLFQIRLVVICSLREILWNSFFSFFVSLIVYKCTCIIISLNKNTRIKNTWQTRFHDEL